jgi:hypothetical protein
MTRSSIGGIRTSCVRLSWPALLAMVMVAWPAVSDAQEPIWSIGVRGGLLVGSSEPTALDQQTVVSLRRIAPLVSLDVIRTLSPDALQIGVNYRIHRRRDADTRARKWPYVGLFVGGIGRGGSSPISLPASVPAGSSPAAARSVALRFPGGWGIGVDGGFRYRFNEQFSLDVNVKWQHLGLLLGETASLSWNPLLITGGVVVRLF